MLFGNIIVHIKILEIYSNPESVARGYHSRYLLAELLSKIGTHLGASAVLVDLRAGLSEFSAPLIFDPRVKKYIVTSTSLQSVQGTKILLGLIRRGLPISEDGILPEILLTMIPEGLDITEIKSNLIEELDDIENENAYTYTDTMVTELPFASELIHLSSLKQIMRKLEGRDFYNNIHEFVVNRYEAESSSFELESLLEKREEIIRKIHALADDQVTALKNNK